MKFEIFEILVEQHLAEKVKNPIRTYLTPGKRYNLFNLNIQAYSNLTDPPRLFNGILVIITWYSQYHQHHLA